MSEPLRAVDVILAKRHGEAHDRGTLERFMRGYLAGEVPDYQVAAWLMAVVWQGMTPQETADLTEVMADSGERLDLAAFPHALDKHSTGGVGDKTTLVLAPLVAELGGTVAKMSGRGLGHTGGTVDKLESIPGFRAELDSAAFFRQLREVGVAVTGQTRDLAPADGLLYALRDATGTVASLPLIASSIMSKKLAGGAHAIVLDVKAGRGAFMRTEADARALAEAMVDIGRRAGRRVRAVLSNMNEPLGTAVGHALEVREAIATLRGGGPGDLRELVLVLAQELLAAGGLPTDGDRVEAALDDGSAYERFVRWVRAQGGDPERLDELEIAPDRHAWRAETDGVLVFLDAERVGRAAASLGGGRRHKGDTIDLGVGATLQAKVGDRVRAGDPLVTLHHRGGTGLDEALAALAGAAEIGERVAPRPLVVDVVR